MIGARTWLNPDSDGIWSDSPSAVVEALLTAVAPGGAGAVLLGTPEDRRSVIQSALEQLSADRPVYHLHGSAFAAELPYGALSILLARAETGPEATWHQVTRVLGELLSPAGSAPALVFLSHPQLMDGDSVSVLAQLAQQRRVTLVVQCDRQLDVPADLAALARAGSLQQVAVRPLTPAGTQPLLAAHLGGPVSRVAATVLWRYTGGHAGRLRKVAEDCVATGKLRQVEGQWVLAAGPLPRGEISPVQDVVLRRMSGQRRALLEQVAASGAVQTSDLVRDGNGGELDELQAQGIVRIRSTPTGRVAEIQPMWRDRVLGSLDPARLRELERSAEEHDSGSLRRLRRAEELLAYADLAGAFTLLSVESSPGNHLRWATAREMLAAGDLAGVDQVLQASPDPADPFFCVLSATLAAARGDLPAARHWSAATSSAAAGSDLLDAGSPGWNGETVRLWAESLGAEVASFAGDHDGARRAAGGIDEQLGAFHQRGVLDAVMGTYDRALVATSLLETSLRCGDLEACRELAEAILTTRHGNPQAVLIAELVIVALEVLSGRFEQAGPLAAQLAQQADVLGDRHAAAVARLMAGFCGSAIDRGRSGTLQPASGAVEPLAWGRLGWFAEILRCLTVAPDLSGAAAIARALALADRAAADGLDVVELHALLGAALLGSSDVAARLQESAAATTSALSGPSAELAAAILEDDPAGFCTALTGLAAAGYAGWCHGGVTSVVARLSPAEARRLAEAVARQHEPDPYGAADATPDWMDSLTPREREIARLVVDGLSNATIARRQGISVRTVEGHLYQVYAKLQVRGRFGLTRLAARSASAHAID